MFSKNMIKEWAEDIRSKTKNMNKEQRAEYVMTYYWYHILLGALFLGLAVLCIYHVSWGKKKTDFSVALVNQDVNFARDEEIRDGFAQESGISSRRISVDSDYLISYKDVQLSGVNESSYEKFFFNWAAGEIDAMIIPESFYHYCRELDGEFLEPADLYDGIIEDELFYMDDGKAVGIYAGKTGLGSVLKVSSDDPFILVFPKELKHKEACGKFLEYIL